MTASAGTNADWRARGVLGLIVLTSVTLVAWEFKPPAERVAVDTKFRAGTHVTLVVVAPTSLPDPVFASNVRSALDSIRSTTLRKGFLFSTIGVSDNWSTERGLLILERMGPFDELIVGRNWLNSGVELYVTALGGRAAVPQLVVVARQIAIDERGVHYGETHELQRVVGGAELENWSRRGFAMDFEPLTDGSRRGSINGR